MALRLVSGERGQPLARAVADLLEIELTPCSVERFPDGELRPRVGPLYDGDVYVVQPTGPPVGDALVELLLMLDGCRRGGPERVTAVLPYFGYARQDRRDRAGEAIGARAVADALTAVGAQRVVVVDPHTHALETMFTTPTEMLTALPTLADAVAETLPHDAVVVAPDLGAAKLAERMAERLGRPHAVVSKTRISGTSVRATSLVGDVAGRPVLIVDDMISTGATIEAAARIALAEGATPDLTVAATHALLVGDAVARLDALPLRRTVVTDTVAVPLHPRWLDVRSVAPLLAGAVRRLHRGWAPRAPGCSSEPAC